MLGVTDLSMSKSEHDAVVFGGTPGGITTAVRAAREGLNVVLVTYNEHLGGMMSGGLSVTDTKIDRDRNPLLDEFFERVRKHYANEYGTGSEQYEVCNNGRYFEPHIAEQIFEDLVTETDSIAVHREYYPVSVNRAGRKLESVSVESFVDESHKQFSGKIFIDATYEGDLASTAGVPYRLGRESRDEFNEQYAGRIFSEKETRLFPGSTGEGDDAIQAYDYRLCLTRNKDNRRYPHMPERYDRTEFLWMVKDTVEKIPEHGNAYKSELLPSPIKSELIRPSVEEIREMGLERYLLLRGPLPNKKRDLNTADLPGEADDYPEADWEHRREIAQRHREHVLGMLYFLQNDNAVPDDIQEAARKWGLPRDEFTDNDNFPFQLYVREARRIIGRKTFTEHDARLTTGLNRAPINADSIAIAEYPMDSHDCRPVRRPGSLADGHFFLGEISVPSQVPYRTLLPEDVDNLLVPVALSATHIGFGTIRLEPTWVQIAEAAGFAASLAIEKEMEPADLPVDELQSRLVAERSMISFFEDVHIEQETDWVPSIQYLGTKGFFDSYHARPNDHLSEALSKYWIETAVQLVDGTLNATERARQLPSDEEPSITELEFVNQLSARLSDHIRTDEVESIADEHRLYGDSAITRGDACQLIMCAVHNIK